MGRPPLDPSFLLEDFYQRLLKQHNIPPHELLKLFEKHDLDPTLVEALFSTVLQQHRSLQHWGKKTELKRELNRLVDEAIEEEAVTKERP